LRGLGRQHVVDRFGEKPAAHQVSVVSWQLSEAVALHVLSVARH
jgi:hypothetical protein